MKNFKRTLALVIAVIMVIGCVSVGVSAAGAKWYSGAVAFIESKGIAIIGADADKKITRNDFVLWVAKIESRQPSDSAWNEPVASVDFSDVTDAHHKAAIAYSKMRGFIIGNGDGTFSPDKALSYAEACAVIVRMMGYENKVTDTSPANWAFNYMQVANTYAHAIDATFMKETDTYNPDYELSQAEAAYLLASIMNYNKKPGDSNFSTTADGIDLGEYFGDAKGNIGKAFYVVKMDRVAVGESLSTLIHLGGQKGIRYTNEIDVTKNVVLQSVDGSSKIEISGADFLKLVRISLGLNPVKDIANEEAEINVYATVDVGSIVNLVIDAATGKVTSLKASGNSVIVDTYLQATDAVAGDIYGNNSNGSNATNTVFIQPDDLARYVGWTIREIVPKTASKTIENTCPALPLSYDESKVTSWTNVVKDANGVITSAVLNFRGQTYAINGVNDEIAIMMPGTKTEGEGEDAVTVDTLVPMSVDAAVKAIINAAQGEVQLVFNDEDGDGRYDSVIVKESDPFLYAGTPNIAGSDSSTSVSYYSSISNGQSLGTTTMKGYNIGAVIYNKTVEFAQGGTSGVADYRTDGYSLKDSNTGKLQLILRASNKHFFIDGKGDYGNAAPHFYKVVDLADFGVGIIEEVDTFSLNNYYIAKIRLTDGTVRQVYIPVEAPATTTIPVTVAGATADYTFDSSAWCTFLTEAKNAVIAAGIVSGVEDAGYKAATGAWMAGKYVQFATDAENKAICILGTDSATTTSGFVAGIEKTTTGDNTYNVSIKGTAGVSTVEVRANASSMFDWSNYTVYNAIFAGKLSNPYAMADGKILPAKDLIYVSVQQDAGSKYLVYSGVTVANPDKETATWNDIEGEHIINIKELERTVADDKSSYTATYEATVGFGPYYERTFNTTKKAYEYVLKFTSVVVFTGVEGSANAVIDTTKTVMIPLYQGATGTTSTQIKATTPADFEKYTIANGYYIDDTTYLVYKLETSEIVYKTDKDGNVIYGAVTYDWENGEVANTYTEGDEVLFETYKVGKYATLTYAAADRNVEGWFPGLYMISIDDTTYSAVYSTPVIIVTPSSNGFTVTITTLQNVPAKGLFATDWNAEVKDGKITAIAVVGEAATEYNSGSVVEPPVDDKGTLVYLDATAKGIVKALGYGKNWIVMSDKSAYALPSGEDIGTIYREYSTYEEATKAASIDLTIQGGHWYKVDENGKILSDATTVAYNQFNEGIDLSTYKKVTMSGSMTGSNYQYNLFDFYVPEDTVVTQEVDHQGRTVDIVEDGTIALYNDNGTWRYKNCVKAAPHAQRKNYRFGNTSVDGISTPKTYNMNDLTYVKTVGDIEIYVDLAGDTYAKYTDGLIYQVNPETYEKVEVSATLSLIQTGTLTSATASGQTIATMNGVKGVDISGYKFAFFYKNAEKTVLYKAGNSTSVSIANEATYKAQFANEQTAYDNALAAYNDALTKDYLSAERLAYYKAEVDKTESALTEKKNSLLDRYFNGQFWNVPNSPYYQYVTVGSGSFQQPTSDLTFSYVLVGDTYCVFSDEFILG